MGFLTIKQYFSSNYFLLALHASSAPTPYKHFVVVNNINICNIYNIYMYIYVYIFIIYIYICVYIYIYIKYCFKQLYNANICARNGNFNLILLSSLTEDIIVVSICYHHQFTISFHCHRPFKHQKENTQALRRFKLAKLYRS